LSVINVQAERKKTPVSKYGNPCSPSEPYTSLGIAPQGGLVLLSPIAKRNVKLKVIPVLNMRIIPCRPRPWGSRDRAPRILNLGTRWGRVVRLTPRLHYPGKRSHDTHWREGWVDPIAGLVAAGERKIFTLAGIRAPIIQPLAESLC
jgi:hypothetical protein